MLLLPLVLPYQVDIMNLTINFECITTCCYQANIINCIILHNTGNTAETRRSHLTAINNAINPNHSHFYSENQSHNNIPDPYLMGRLMGTSYANYPSAFSIASRGIPNPTATSQEQSFSKVERSTRGANSNSSTQDPIYVPGAYLVGTLVF